MGKVIQRKLQQIQNKIAQCVKKYLQTDNIFEIFLRNV